MLARCIRVPRISSLLSSRPSVPRVHTFSRTLTTTMAVTDRSQLIPFSSRLKEGRALAEDVWSIFKCVPPVVRWLPQLLIKHLQRCEPPRGLH